jgi:hypothetical protein
MLYVSEVQTKIFAQMMEISFQSYLCKKTLGTTSKI